MCTLTPTPIDLTVSARFVSVCSPARPSPHPLVSCPQPHSPDRTAAFVLALLLPYPFPVPRPHPHPVVMLSAAVVPVPAHHSGCVECVHPRTKWHRTSRVLLLLSVIQIATSIYIFLDRQAMFFAFYLSYACVACALMALRVKLGLLWFAGGSMLYGIWLSVLMWRAVMDRIWVEMCLDFALATFELLVFCLSVGRFHELGGFTICCGPPDRNAWKGSLLVGSTDDDSAWHTAADSARSRDGSAAIDGYADGHGGDADLDGGENEVYINATHGGRGGSGELDNSMYTGGPEQSIVYSTTQFARYQPPMPLAMPQQPVVDVAQSYSPSSHMFSDLSSVSSSYTNTVGRGFMHQQGHHSDGQLLSASFAAPSVVQQQHLQRSSS